MELSKCCDAEIKIVMVDDHVGHGIHEEAECSNCGELSPDVYDDEETDDIVNTQRMTQTAVEWLEEQLTYKYEGQTLNKFYDWKDISELYNKAKEMHKQEIIDAYKADLYPCSDEDAEQYYNETFKKD